ncbi:hypothetical protein TSUD_253080 [Trifolium subterraneum]|nr:hypothetical protein TSUD_253080 [Trifolium subterraneum]
MSVEQHVEGTACLAVGQGQVSIELAPYPSRIVAQPETANTVDSQPVKYPSPSRFTWRIDRFSERKITVFSDAFEDGDGGYKDYSWRVLIYPKGNYTKDYLSMYLVLTDSAYLPNGWSRYAQFSLTVVNQINNKHVRKDTEHQFNKLQSYWGFKNFIPVDDVFDPSRGYLVNNTLVVEVEEILNKICTMGKQESLKRKQEEKKHKIEQNAEAFRDTTIVKVVRDEDLAEQIGKDIYFDLVDPDKVRSFHVHDRTTSEVFKAYPILVVVGSQNSCRNSRQATATSFYTDMGTTTREVLMMLLSNNVAVTFSVLSPHEKWDFKKDTMPTDYHISSIGKELAKVFGIPVRYQRLRVWERNLNHTHRPSFLLKRSDHVGSIAKMMVDRQFGGHPKLVLFLEVERGQDLRPIQPLLKISQCEKLLFFKLYDLEKEELRYVGRLFVNHTDKPLEILTRLNKLAGYDPDEEIEFYEEIMFEPKVMCEPVDKKLTFAENKIGNYFTGIICFQKVCAMDNVKHIRFPDVPSYFEYVHNGRVPFSPSDRESLDEQNKNIITEAMNVDKNIEAQQSKGDKETTYDEEVVEMDPNLPEELLQELRDIAFKEDLVEKLKGGLTPKVNLNTVKEKIDANAGAFSSQQLEQVGVVVNLLNNIVMMYEKLENLKKERDSAKRSTDQDNEALKETRQTILTSKTSFTNHQTQLNSIDAQIADLKAKLEKLQGDRTKIAEIQNQEKDKITSLNKEVKSIFHRLADEQIKLKSVEDQIPEAQTELESHKRLYRIFKETPPF